jgi:radical SAM protein with 4Fe4S-binding SPASM domain
LSNDVASPSSSRRFMNPDGEARLHAMARRAILGRIPLNGSIAMTHRCNLRCHHCYLGEERFTPLPGGEQPTEFWLSILDQATDAGCLHLLITGGEVLLRTDFARVYAHAIRRGLLTTVFSNGTLVDDRVVALFAELPPQLVEISLYGASEEVYERVTTWPGSYKRCLHGIDALVAAGIPLGLKAMILADNKHEIPRMREMARERGLDFRVDPNVLPRFSGDQAPLGQRVPACEAVALEVQDPVLVERSVRYYEQRRDLPSEPRLFSCMAGVTGFHVDPHGTLLPCQVPSNVSYDLRTGSFLEGWEGEIARFHEQGIAPGYECHECSAREICGLCPAQFALETGSPYRKSDYNCSLGTARLAALDGRLAAAPEPSRPAGSARGGEGEPAGGQKGEREA